MRNSSRVPVAIVGYGCVLPDAANPTSFWDNSLKGASALKPVDGFKTHLSTTGAEDTYYSIVAGRVRDYAFDWRRFRIPPTESELINPMQLMTLDAGAQALEHIKVLPRERTGLILGATGFGWQRDSGLRIRAHDMLGAAAESKTFSSLDPAARASIRARTLARLDGALKPVSEDNVVNASASVACGRIAMHFDLKGLHYAVDAGFASALAALDVAMSLLADGTLDMVVSGGASELLSPLELAGFAKLGGLATHELRAFDAAASGTLLGEGVALFALKRLDDALADGEKIHAVLHAVEGSTDRAKNALVAPNPEGQRLAMQRAWEACDRDPASASFIECHATGTQVGDASEVAALAMLVEKRPAQRIPLTSSKPVVGHLRAASGAVALLKAVLALEHRTLPKQVGFAQPNPALELDQRPFMIPTSNLTLDAKADLFAGVSAFGFGGINYHAVLSTAPQFTPAKKSTRRPTSQEPIAIVGLGGRFPGANDVGTFWQRLLEGHDATRTIPAERWDVERYFSEDRDRKDTCYTRLGCFLDQLPVVQERWRIPPAAVQALDPSQLLLLQVAEEALSDARLASLSVDKQRVAAQLAFLPYQGKKFLADARMHWRYFSEWLQQSLAEARVSAAEQHAILNEAQARYKRNLPPISEDTITGYLGNIGAARVARAFGFNGPHFVVDSACASTHAALDASVRALRLGQIDMALSGGVWCDMMPEFFVAACRFQALSAAGSRPFSAHADGFIPGEGAGIFVLRRLSDAERDGEKIYALLRSVAGSSDGKGRSVLAPTVEGETLAMRRAIEASGVDASTIDYVECHGTGTALGDVVETQAVQAAYDKRDKPLLIGSVKSNIGHLNAAAGVPALMKTALALQTGMLPASLKAAPLNPKIGFERGLIDVVREKRAWPETHGRPRRAAVSGFGVGGSNMHMIVEQYLAPQRAKSGLPDGITASERDGVRIAIVGQDAATRDKRASLLRDMQAKHAPLSVLRKQGIYVHAGEREPVCLTFPGQGPQYANMARELVRMFAPAREQLERLDVAYLALAGRPLSAAFWTQEAGNYEQRDEDIHCAVFAVSCAIAAVLRARNLRYDAVLGQSAGLYAALVAADVLSPEDGLRAVRDRTRAVLGLTLADPGKMLYVSCNASAAEALFAGAPGFVTIAADNGPRACIVAGDTRSVCFVQERARTNGLEADILPVSHAYHSRIIAPAGEVFRATLSSLTFKAPRVDVYSSVDGSCISKDEHFDWASHLIAQFSEPVRMPQAVAAAYRRGCRVFVECGPKWPLTSFVEDILADKKPIAIATMHPKVGECEQMLRAIAELHTLKAFSEGTMTKEAMSLQGLLDRARSVRQTLEHMLQPAAAALTPAAPVAVANVAPANDVWDSIHQLLLSETALKTGYPADMLELDLDLEADLGIDTVKQLAIVSEVRKKLSLEVDPRFKLRDFRTLRALIDHFAERAPSPTVSTSAAAVPALAPPSPAPSQSNLWQDLRDRLVRETANKTGYPADMLELDLDLEADLGIDTVKQLAIVSEVRKSLGREIDPRFKLRDFRTLRALIDHFAAAPTSTLIESKRAGTPLTRDAYTQLASNVNLLRAGAMLSGPLGAPRHLLIRDLWLAPFAETSVDLIVTTTGERLQAHTGAARAFECVVSETTEALTTRTATMADTQMPSALTRREPGSYVTVVSLTAEQSVSALLDAVFLASATCWVEAYGERTVTLRAREIRIDRAAWTQRRFKLEITLAAAPAGQSRASVSVCGEDGMLVCTALGIEGEWPSAAGDATLARDAWQALRTSARDETRESTNK